MKRSPSKFLILLSNLASLSELLTLLASSPNLIVSQTLVDHGFEKLGFFEITPIEVFGVIVGIFYLYAGQNILLPSGERKNNSKDEHRLSTKQLVADYRLGGQLFRVSVPEGSPMIGKRLAQLKLP